MAASCSNFRAAYWIVDVLCRMPKISEGVGGETENLISPLKHHYPRVLGT